MPTIDRVPCAAVQSSTGCDSSVQTIVINKKPAIVAALPSTVDRGAINQKAVIDEEPSFAHQIPNLYTDKPPTIGDGDNGDDDGVVRLPNAKKNADPHVGIAVERFINGGAVRQCWDGWNGCHVDGARRSNPLH